ncbi:hypothetical protein ACH5RR_013437 [Cinchona calisaya]|uniref:Uncharacterized protein n=1 Tax=Cinchona calisaya TaxID=153742 RepID=A0ABD3A009_9GENT
MENLVKNELVQVIEKFGLSEKEKDGIIINCLEDGKVVYQGGSEEGRHIWVLVEVKLDIPLFLDTIVKCGKEARWVPLHEIKMKVLVEDKNEGKTGNVRYLRRRLKEFMVLWTKVQEASEERKRMDHLEVIAKFLWQPGKNRNVCQLNDTTSKERHLLSGKVVEEWQEFKDAAEKVVASGMRTNQTIECLFIN